MLGKGVTRGHQGFGGPAVDQVSHLGVKRTMLGVSSSPLIGHAEPWLPDICHSQSVHLPDITCQLRAAGSRHPAPQHPSTEHPDPRGGGANPLLANWCFCDNTICSLRKSAFRNTLFSPPAYINAQDKQCSRHLAEAQTERDPRGDSGMGEDGYL